jgi:antitoxin StbD
MVAKSSVSITDLKRILRRHKEAEGATGGDFNQTAFRLYRPAEAFEAMWEKLADLEIKKTIRKRRGGKSVPVYLDAL